MSPFVTSGIRIGTPAVTSRGFTEKEMVKIADFMYKTVNDFDNSAFKIRAEVEALCNSFPIY